MTVQKMISLVAQRCLLCLLLCSAVELMAGETETASRATLVSAERIWGKEQSGARHHAFADLIRFNDRWWCCLREGERHVYGQDGKIRLLTSADGKQWESAALLEEAGVDLRDPSLSVMPDGRLMLVCGGSVYEDLELDGRKIVNGKFIQRQPRVAFSDDGRTWTKPRKILGPGHWLWRVTWHKGTAYGLSKIGYDANPAIGLKKEPRRGILFTSKDGIQWTEITEWKGLVTGLVSETRLRFTKENEMIAAIRPVFIGWSKPPYTDWEFRRSERALQGPNLIILPDGSFWASSRYYERLTPEQQKELGTTKPHAARQAFFRIERDGSVHDVLLLPSGGDTGYAGLVWHADHVWMAYYASGGIYFAKIKVSLK